MSSMLYKFVIVKCQENLKTIIIDFFKTLLGHRIIISQPNECIVILYDNIEEIDLCEVINSLNQELLSDIYLYDSDEFFTMLEIEEISKIIIKKFIMINSFNKYYNKKILVKESLSLTIDEAFKKLCLKHYYNDKIMHNILKVFFDNNMNTSKSAKILYLHRNTLINKLDKFVKDTNYDVKNFNDAIVIYSLIAS